MFILILFLNYLLYIIFFYFIIPALDLYISTEELYF